ncbi:glutathione S-transferase family protein [Solimicrobium silvestre]|uniref:Glutathione S-transferase n=1 Tax=Solimicrobium silvestre TaxID=2099400 RepID=A0A2S9GVR2_9BURK|nr:glutathione S-transferase [Solimicrobium silvestre]PRC91817.1 Glutathione S-transferase [Solimicrobium silvestre]
MLKILGKSSSINVRKVLWTCAEIGIPYDLEQWGAGAQATNTPYFLSLNPNGMVPVIQDGPATLWESNSICRYLAGKHQRVDLLPAEPLARAQVEKWMDWQATELNNAWRYAFMALVRRSAAHEDPAAITASVLAWNRHMAILDAQLANTGAYANGATFTLADIVLGLSVHRWMAAPIERPQLSAVDIYYARLSERDGFMQHGRNGLP